MSVLYGETAMAKRKPENWTQKLRAVALKLPDVTEGIACAGTSLEKRTIKVKDKAFVFLGVGDVMLKLGDSLPEAQSLAVEQPARCKAGATGWVTIRWSDAEPPPESLENWIRESYTLMASAKKSKASPKKKSKPAAKRHG